MSGLWKVYGAITQFLAGEMHALAFDAVALHIAYWLPRWQSPSLLGPFLIEHPWVGWPFFIAIIYLQFFAFWIAFRPNLHQLWGVGLVLFHVGVYVTMGIVFFHPILLLIFLFFDSPFKKPQTSWQEIVSDLPLWGWIWKILWRKSA